ncbi:extracellular solute-binding protein [Mesorhizobium sp. B3-1-9]|uniref:extracellular solute-binding protein n=1 Tax=unclassified Mesorhizobium TaxID=325217 RepID=UPI0011278F33|nr:MULTISPECIES: extracellular solute-binding protein [unclassified Mesorhizobium]TPI38143.1 extracellular solute-binding protein [Mesorhizobium sp. B3-1-9]TPI59075.1 extracellular solute-binding protein [Mesorhizobium sp. B3-1-7]TPI69540.1 extracellular solute-binding protein [Mesorhizobium sp. B3-1-8]TPI73788.1 extracellular solute-binding protein [Mesorhizobium sp. B3-1-3]UCI28571.1 extracellular solute-binding protein [Mesorhizobium sp. B2-8-5]
MDGKLDNRHLAKAKSGHADAAGLTRRDLMQRAAMLGIAGAFANFGFPALAADFDWKKHAGTKLSILMTGDENDHRALGDMLDKFKEDTGMELEITSPALGALIEKTLQNLKADHSSFELIEYLGFLTTQQVGAGYYEQLNSYIDDPSKTPPDWDVADFLPPAMSNVGIFDMASGTVGKGKDIYGIPGLHSGSVIYFYRKDLFEAAGLKPATNWDEFKDAAIKLNKDDVAGCSFIGANDFSLAAVDWYTRFITTGGKLMSGSPKEKNFKPNVNSPEGIGALQMLIDLLPYAPKNVTKYGFAENVDGFSTGKIAQMIFWSTIAGPILNGDNSMVSDKTGTGPVPAKPGETARAIQGGWGMGIPKNIDPAKKDAAWLALTWMTSKAFNKFEVEKYQIDASRTSAFTDPDLVAKLPYLPDALKAASTAEIIPTSLIPEFFQLNDIMNVEFNAALIGTQDAKTACEKVQTQWEAMLRKAGHLA